MSDVHALIFIVLYSIILLLAVLIRNEASRQNRAEPELREYERLAMREANEAGGIRRTQTQRLRGVSTLSFTDTSTITSTFNPFWMSYDGSEPAEEQRRRVSDSPIASACNENDVPKVRVIRFKNGGER